jgi:hypothetical protein
MFYSTNKSVFKRMTQELGARKDTLVIAEDADAAQVIAENMRQEIEVYDHVDSGRLLNSINATKRGGEDVVVGAEYAKFVNGYDKEKGESGFVQDAVDRAILDGYNGEAVV